MFLNRKTMMRREYAVFLPLILFPTKISNFYEIQAAVVENKEYCLLAMHPSNDATRRI